MLRSKLLSPSKRLNECEVKDPAHVQLGDKGEYVTRIQQALLRIENAAISAPETSAGLYGQSTAAAVLAYKRKRGIINYSYQTKADNIVGKMTIRSLDDEMLKLEASTNDEYFAAGLRPFHGRYT